VLKVELHAHTGLDPVDYIPHSTDALIDRAAALGYHALAITLHDRHYDGAAHAAYARSRGIVLIPGVERTISGRHVLLINFPAEAAEVTSFEGLRRLKTRCPHGLVVAPHAFYPTPSALGRDADTCLDIIDAVEVNSMYTSRFDYNGAAIAWAGRHGKPIVGNTDLHLLEQLGTTWSLVDAAADPDAICDAIRAGRVEVRSTPLSTVRAIWIFSRMLAWGAVGRVRAFFRRRFRPVADEVGAGHGPRGVERSEERR
jgi:predicted metal-dependent phosphoesterase TrpH